ncbi:MAG: hypothetical protein ACOZNI_30295 [Myxococcota bacterium]
MPLFLLSPAPADWFYADRDDAIVWSSVAFDGGDVTFRTVGDGLLSGPVDAALALDLACGDATRVTLAYVDGVLVDVVTFPENRCVAAAARAAEWDLAFDGVPLAATAHALVVLDVPASEDACSRS